VLFRVFNLNTVIGISPFWLKKSYTVGKECNLCRVKPIRIAVSSVMDVSWGGSSIGPVSVFGGINKMNLDYFCRSFYAVTNIIDMVIIIS